MAKKQSFKKNRTAILTVAIILSIILYLAGVFSGLYANKIIEKKTTADLLNLKNETNTSLENIKTGAKQDFDILSDYIKFLDGHLQNLQLEQTFMETLSSQEKCNFTEIAMDSLLKQFEYYWDRLPLRIEEYESQVDDLSQEYVLLKQQYTQLSIRTWILANNRNKECNGDLITILYFYTRNCNNCVAQGEVLDELRNYYMLKNKDVLIFTVDLNSDFSIIRYMKQYNQIESAPALLIDDTVYQGRVFNLDELKELT